MRMEWTPKRLITVGSGLAGVTCLGLYFILYAPLLEKLRSRSTECRTVESDVQKARNLIAAFREKEAERSLISQQEVSSAMEELTRQGKSGGVNFVSLTPGAVEDTEGREYRILPIEMEIESTYEALGHFLGLLDEMEKSLLKVQSFNVVTKGEDPSQVHTRLTVYLYLAKGPQGG